jgi:hypothetical protein
LNGGGLQPPRCTGYQRRRRKAPSPLRIAERSFEWIEALSLPTFELAGYAAFTDSESLVKKAYIRNQEEHHKKISFKEELIALLRKNKIPFDEKYLLD